MDLTSGAAPLGSDDGDASESVSDLACAARIDTAVLITGDHGAEAQTIAKAIHRRSRRAEGPLMMIDCAATSDAALESQLFGAAVDEDAAHETGGFLEQAHRGTMFLARVDAMSLRLQSRLFEFLDRCEVRRAGAEGAPARVDVRLIASAGRSLFARGVGVSFRQDLFYRLNTIHLVMPAECREGGVEPNIG